MKLPISQIKLNPSNPRTIKDDNFKKLVKSIKDFPEMTDIRPVVVNKEYMILGGNMRFRAMQEAGWKEIPVRVVDLPEDKQKEFIIKDNVSGGDWDWDMLANEWDKAQLAEWGMDVEQWADEEVKEDEAPALSILTCLLRYKKTFEQPPELVIVQRLQSYGIYRGAW